MFEKIIVTPLIPSQDGWSTSNEKDFINDLGKHAPTFRASLGISKNLEMIRHRLQLLEGYSSGLAQRHRWGKIDPNVIHRYVAMAIEKTRAELFTASS